MSTIGNRGQVRLSARNPADSTHLRSFFFFLCASFFTSIDISVLTLDTYMSLFIYIYTYVTSRKPADSLAHGPPTAIFAHCLATRSRQPPLSSLGVPFFTLKMHLSQEEKGHPPKRCCLFLPPVRVAAMSTSPHEGTLCPMLANHLILHAKSVSPSTGHE